MQIDIWHNILWSKYKARVFSELSNLCQSQNIEANFFQIAETDSQRANLSNVDTSVHKYPYNLLFKGSYYEVPLIKRIAKIVALTWASKADMGLVAGYDRIEYWIQILLYKIKGKKVSVFCDSTTYDNKKKRHKEIAKKIVFSLCDRVFCYGLRAQEYIMSYGVPINKTSFRCQAAYLPDNYNSNDILNKRNEAKKNNLTKLLYVGRLSKEKNIEDAIKAVKTIKDNGENIEFNIVGSGPLKDELGNLISLLNAHEYIKLLGSKSGNDLYEEYLKASMLILPSSSEPWGLVVNEALAYGCPVIVSNYCGCVPELVKDGITGYSYNCGNIQELTNKITKLIGDIKINKLKANECIRIISSYSPINAAIDIINGITLTLDMR